MVVAYALYAAGFVANTVYTVDGHLVFALFDDAMISLRYAHNLARGHGLLWNVGDAPVEGISNPLWAAWMAALHHLAPPHRVSLYVQLTGGVLVLVTMVLCRGLAVRVWSRPWAGVLAMVLVGTYLPLNTWVLQGMEVGVVAAATAAAAALALDVSERRRSASSVIALLALLPLVRLDAVVPGGVTLVWLAWVLRSWRPLVVGGAAIGAGLLVQTALRWGYYGELLPNTYHLKMTGAPVSMRLMRGAAVAGDFLFHPGGAVVVAGLSTALVRPAVPRRALLAAQVVAAFAYSIYVGGDAWDDQMGGANRFLCGALPLAFVLAAGPLSAAPGALAARLRGGRVLGALVVVAAWVGMSAVDGEKSLRAWSLVGPPLHADARDRGRMVELGLHAAEITTPEATLAVVRAGVIPFFADRNAVDLLGKSDAVLARMDAVPDEHASGWRAFYPGHMKYDYAHSLSLAPDLVLQAWKEPQVFQAMLIERGYRLVRYEDLEAWALGDSEHVRWDRVTVVAP